MAQIIDGKMMAKRIRQGIAEKVMQLRKRSGITPKLTVILVGENEASRIYVRNKERACEEAGMQSETIALKSGIKEKELVGIIRKLNNEMSVHGILVQSPLPEGLDELAMMGEIDPKKDVDGLHPYNMGKLLKGEKPNYLPCTPSGIMELLLSTGIDLKGKRAVVVGRSNIVGKPTALLLLERHATVTVCHSRTIDLKDECLRADVLVAAVGRAELIKGSWIKQGSIIIDVGMNRLETGLVGDVAFKEAEKIAGYITPVPGGVGPMTIAMLLRNTLTSAERSAASR